MKVGAKVKIVRMDGSISDLHGIGEIQESCGEGWWWVKFQDHSYFYAEKQLLVIEEV